VRQSNRCVSLLKELGVLSDSVSINIALLRSGVSIVHQSHAGRGTRFRLPSLARFRSWGGVAAGKEVSPYRENRSVGYSSRLCAISSISFRAPPFVLNFLLNDRRRSSTRRSSVLVSELWLDP